VQNLSLIGTLGFSYPAPITRAASVAGVAIGSGVAQGCVWAGDGAARGVAWAGIGLALCGAVAAVLAIAARAASTSTVAAPSVDSGRGDDDGDGAADDEKLTSPDQVVISTTTPALPPRESGADGGGPVPAAAAVAAGPADSRDEQPRSRLPRAVPVTVLVLVTMLHPKVGLETLAVMRCRTIEGRELMSADLSVSCDSARYARAVTLAIASLMLFTVGTVALIFAVLGWARPRADPAVDPEVDDSGRGVPQQGRTATVSTAAVSAASAPHLPSLQRKQIMWDTMEYLASPFDERMFWYGAVVMLRKSLLVAIGLLVANEPDVAAYLATIVFVASVVANLALRPHRRDWPAVAAHGNVFASAYARIHAFLAAIGGGMTIDTCGLLANLVTVASGPTFGKGASVFFFFFFFLFFFFFVFFFFCVF
jgi:hypothetical protein